MKKKIGFKLAVILLSAAFVFAGCSGDKVDTGDNGVDDGKKEELILAIGNEPDDGFDPTTGWGRYGSPLFQSTLLTRNQDFEIENDLATGYEISEDGLQWSVDIREDVVFTDGEPLTASDVVYTFETAATSGSVLDLSNLEKVEMLNDFSVVFTLKQPQSTFVHTLATTGIVPEHAHDEGYSSDPIGSGPFKFVQWDKGQQLIVEANPSYYGDVPAFKKLTFLFLGDDGAFAAARAGQVDVAAVPASFAKQEVAGMELVRLESVDNRGILFPYVSTGKKTENGDPIGNDVTSDIAIRKAINIGIDREALVDGILEGFGTPAYSVSDGLPWWNEETVITDGRLEEAKNLLKEAGWVDTDQDGIVEKNGRKAEFNLLYPAGDQIRQSLAMAAADMIKPLGIQVIAEGKSWDEIERSMYSDAVLFGWGSYDPLEMYNLYSSNTAGEGYYNTGYYGNPIVDEYMEQALHAKIEEEAISFWKKAQWDGNTGFSAKGDAPWAWLVNLNHLYLVNDKLDIGTPKIQPHGHGWPLTDNIAQWKWKEQ
ncbi:ABC transporter substrate-binding protein [Alkalibacter rhizosphaerae]|uniref:ABC transporter substrate-binding protein n=1 Tax=Alkalibacter rhizosphaerae TaxID=2815577 RepID=A0A974XEY7_9FIRM|nr:ABC transporter substrate-binding protein [Alkalibacter rhizosphaerae]QSX08516.1 ABC transporter substrate-binding protein [Alkalibacter rhizosphaerae]